MCLCIGNAPSQDLPILCLVAVQHGKATSLLHALSKQRDIHLHWYIAPQTLLQLLQRLHNVAVVSKLLILPQPIGHLDSYRQELYKMSSALGSMLYMLAQLPEVPAFLWRPAVPNPSRGKNSPLFSFTAGW